MSRTKLPFVIVGVIAAISDPRMFLYRWVEFFNIRMHFMVVTGFDPRTRIVSCGSFVMILTVPPVSSSARATPQIKVVVPCPFLNELKLISICFSFFQTILNDVPVD